MTRLTKPVAVLAVGACVASCSLPRHAEPEEHPVKPPLARLQVDHNANGTPEIYAELAPGVTLAQAVAIDVFDGFSARLTPERAAATYGPPSGEWQDPVWFSNSPYYDRPLARLSLGQFYGSDGKPSWKTVAYPRRAKLPDVVVDERLLSQIAAVLPSEGEAEVTVARPIGYGRVQLFVTRETCRAIIRLEDGS